MALPDRQIDLARAKLTFDKLYDPNTDVERALKQIDYMSQTVKAMAGPGASARVRLVALRKYIYESGTWNGNRPFQYDLSDPLGRKPENRLLATYLRTHRGNCVSMPILFVALAQRLNLNATLATAPDHMFVRYTDDVTGKVFDLEATNGGSPERDVFLRRKLPMTDAAITNGIYMKTLSRKEVLVVLARGLIEHEMAVGHYRLAWDIADLLRPHYPNDLAVLLTPANAAMALVREEYLGKYPHKEDIPPELLARLDFLQRSVSDALNHAYALGWREADGETQLARSTSASTEPSPATPPQP